jgi:hypothetical protein
MLLQIERETDPTKAHDESFKSEIAEILRVESLAKGVVDVPQHDLATASEITPRSRTLEWALGYCQSMGILAHVFEYKGDFKAARELFKKAEIRFKKNFRGETRDEMMTAITEGLARIAENVRDDVESG